VNILKVFDDFRQLSREDQRKIVEWFNSTLGASGVFHEARTVESSTARKVRFAPRKFTEEQLDYIDYWLHDGKQGCKIAESCEARWPNERSYDAWLTTVNKRKRDMKEKVQA
jgi:hypothetical protein